MVNKLMSLLGGKPPISATTDSPQSSRGDGYASQEMDIAALKEQGLAFEQKLREVKHRLKPADFWYPYGTLSNLIHLERLLTGDHRHVLRLIDKGPAADIGAADGDLAFFLEAHGIESHVVDYGPTNFNSLQGVRLLKNELQSSITISEVDLDAQFLLPEKYYRLVFFLGILYHLKNPYLALEQLAKSSEYCFLSTRVATHSPDYKTMIKDLPVAYLLGPTESNNDSTNYWIFSKAGLHRILSRTGWEVLDEMTVGSVGRSDPAHSDRDERYFALLRSKKVRSS
jgi:tRNA (mo5U34)-methyltransferase